MKHTTSKKPALDVAPRWVKATIIYRNVYHLGAGLGLAAHLQLEGLAMMCYFARYTSPPFRLEFQMFTQRPLAHLRKAIMNYRKGNVSPLAVNFEPCNGSHAHAAATEVVMALAGQHELTAVAMMDVVHWAFNMAGFSYVQEAGILAAQAHTALRNVPGWSNDPIFGQSKAAPAARTRAAVKRFMKSKD